MKLFPHLKKCILAVLVLGIFVFMKTWNGLNMIDLIISVPFFLVLYFFFFTVGDSSFTQKIQQKIDNQFSRALVFPALLILLLYSYILLNGGNPFKESILLLPSLLLIPTLVFVHPQSKNNNITWLDFTVLIFYLVPLTLVHFPAKADLPVHGGTLDSVYRIVMMLSIVYAFVVLRGLENIGFELAFKWRYLIIAVLSWLIFYGIIILPGYFTQTLEFGKPKALTIPALYRFLTMFFHTALFEELFFRGLFQNLLQKKIFQSTRWQKYWTYGIIILLFCSLWAGYSIKDGFQWFIALMTLVLFIIAYLLEKNKKSDLGVYTALAITSVFFGLVHYHSGSIIYIGLASLAGWFYGYVYIKTKNVFYAALTHTLVNVAREFIGIYLT